MNAGDRRAIALDEKSCHMCSSVRPRVLAILTGLIVCAGPGLARASTMSTSSSGSRVTSALRSFYAGFERFSAHAGGRRLGAQAHVLRPFYAAFDAQSRDLSARSRLAVVRNSIYEAVRAQELEPVLAQELRTATGLLTVTRGAPHEDLIELRTYFADEIQASRSLSQLAAWERTGFLQDEPAALTRLDADIRQHEHLIDPPQQDVPFRALLPTLTGAQRRQIDPQIRLVTDNLKGLSNLTTEEVASWEEGKPGFPL